MNTIDTTAVATEEADNLFDNNRQMSMAWQITELTSRNLFLTGKAGTGKTTFLQRLRKLSNKRIVVLAPTGIAAINAGGVTIHSFFQLPLSIYIPGKGFPESKRRFDRFNRTKLRMIKTIDLLIIDEISMVRADLLDAIDASLRRHRNPRLPFGGVQLLLIGDLQQLAPVVKPSEWQILSEHYPTPYFFSSRALQEVGFETIELEKVYRQSDRVFLELLNKVRNNTADTNTLNQLNSRYIPDFNPPDSEGYIRLTTHNRQAQEINDAQLARLNTPAHSFNATVKGDFPELAFPTEQTLTLKNGAQVMFLRNDHEQGYYNGMMGRIVAINDSSITVRPHGGDHNLLVEPSVWENNKYTLDNTTGEIKEEIIGTFTQYPLRLAWAVTIHKSQGLTFDKAIINASGSFAHGQTYVALSRCRTLEGLVLDRPLSPSAIINDSNVLSFINEQNDHPVTQNHIEQLRTSFLTDCLDELFGIEPLRISFNNMHRLVEEYLSQIDPALIKEYRSANETCIEPLEKVSQAFAREYRTLTADPDRLSQRVCAGIEYFLKGLAPLMTLINRTPDKTKNKAVSTRLAAAKTDLSEALRIKTGIMEAMKEKAFTPADYLAEKSRVILRLSSNEPTPAITNKARKSAKSTIPDTTTGTSAEINKRILQALINWRRTEAEERKVPAYIILGNKAIVEISTYKPMTIDQLREIYGIGNTKLQMYGEQILQIVKDYAN